MIGRNVAKCRLMFLNCASHDSVIRFIGCLIDNAFSNQYFILYKSRNRFVFWLKEINAMCVCLRSSELKVKDYFKNSTSEWD